MELIFSQNTFQCHCNRNIQVMDVKYISHTHTHMCAHTHTYVRAHKHTQPVTYVRQTNRLKNQMHIKVPHQSCYQIYKAGCHPE